MKKQHYRDYATDAFRFLAAQGSSSKYKQKIWNEAIEEQRRLEVTGTGISCPTEAAILRADEAIFDAQAAISDLEAAEFAISTLEQLQGTNAVKTLKTVYMLDPNRPIRRREIVNRVKACATEFYISDRKIYEWLETAREEFAKKRGLRL